MEPATFDDLPTLNALEYRAVGLKAWSRHACHEGVLWWNSGGRSLKDLALHAEFAWWCVERLQDFLPNAFFVILAQTARDAVLRRDGLSHYEANILDSFAVCLQHGTLRGEVKDIVERIPSIDNAMLKAGSRTPYRSDIPDRNTKYCRWAFDQ